MGIVHRRSRPVCENQGTGPCAGLLPARYGEKDQTATKRVESFRVPCLDAGSTPATSTPDETDSSNQESVFLTPSERHARRCARSRRSGISALLHRPTSLRTCGLSVCQPAFAARSDAFRRMDGKPLVAVDPDPVTRPSPPSARIRARFCPVRGNTFRSECRPQRAASAEKILSLWSKNPKPTHK